MILDSGTGLFPDSYKMSQGGLGEPQGANSLPDYADVPPRRRMASEGRREQRGIIWMSA
jgi:hypothetical protein